MCVVKGGVAGSVGGSTVGSVSVSEMCAASLPASEHECASEFESCAGDELWIGACVLLHVGVGTKVWVCIAISVMCR